MKYGCIGEHLSHSFSKEIHNELCDYEYEIVEIPRDELSDFAIKRDFIAINVTIPYKELIMPYMHYIDSHAKQIGAVNTVVNKDGKLYGYNTDFYGMCALLEHAKIDVRDKKVLILGTGGTSKTSAAVVKALGACEIIKVSRTPGAEAVTYDEAYMKHSDAEIIINTTPVGMFPNIYKSPIDLAHFKSLRGVVDAIYNPLRSELVMDATDRGIAATGGLYMLVAQAKRASEIFINRSHADSELDRVYSKILRSKKNIVLSGMPGCGKSTVGKMLADTLSRELIDTDELIVAKAGMPIKDIFDKFGETYFRNIELEVIKEASSRTGAIISTGGGAVLREENVWKLKKNGRIYFIDRPLNSLIPTDDRPLSSTAEAIEKRYNERYSVYTATADVIIDADCDAACVARKIQGEFGL